MRWRRTLELGRWTFPAPLGYLNARSGACVRCGASEQRQFDHVIPVAKGGADAEGNIQLLCQPCNLPQV